VNLRRLSLITGILAGLSALAFIILAPPSSATKPPAHKVGVCHATTSDTNPYVWIVVDKASTQYQGHLQHRNDPNKRWKSAGIWNGVPHIDGTPKPDFIAGLDVITENICLGIVPTLTPRPTGTPFTNPPTDPPTSAPPTTPGDDDPPTTEPPTPPVTTEPPTETPTTDPPVTPVDPTDPTDPVNPNDDTPTAPLPSELAATGVSLPTGALLLLAVGAALIALSAALRRRA
jgi:hypothetical protein